MTTGQLHAFILEHIIEHGWAPDPAEIASSLNRSTEEILQTLYDLQDEHGVVLHPHAPKVWVIHPFALSPTNFLVRSSHGAWWGNCAWCSLGVAALLNEDVTITTRIGGHDEQIVIHLEDGQVREKDLLIHFPIPMKHAWDNVIYTCSTMLVFKSANEVTKWSKRHRIPEGDILPIDRVWDFSKVWYGNHLNPEWRKWTAQEASQLFKRFGLTHAIWNLEATPDRF